MRRIVQLALTLAALLTLLIVPQTQAAGWNPFGGTDCTGDAAKSTVCSDGAKQDADPSNTDPLTGTDGIILKIATIIAVIAGIAAVIILILAGLRYIQSGGSADDVAGARRAIIYALVGIAIILLARTLIALILSAL